MDPNKRTARFAGFLYLIFTLSGIYGMMFLPTRILVTGDPAASAGNVLANEFLFRSGIINDLFSNIIWVILVLVLYRLFKQVNMRQAKLMVAFVIVQIPVAIFLESFNIASLALLKGDILKTFEPAQRQDLAMLFLKISDYGVLVLEMFWGIWLIPFGILVYRSGFIPRIIGILLLIGGIGYMGNSFISLLLPDYLVYVNKTVFFILVAPGEFSIMLWLLIMGVKKNVPAPINNPA
jgi:hypothetical protein